MSILTCQPRLCRHFLYAYPNENTLLFYRQEQERKRQMELEKQLEKQRAAEHEREEQRRKAMEQREVCSNFNYIQSV